MSNTDVAKDDLKRLCESLAVENKELRKALSDIKAHQVLVSDKLAPHTAPWLIADKALSGASKLEEMDITC